MGECHEDQKIRRPGVHRPDQPSELHLGHDELHALESLVGSRTVVHQQQGSSEHLHPEEKQRHAAEEIPVRVAMYRYFLLLRQRLDVVQRKAFVEPLANAV